MWLQRVLITGSVCKHQDPKTYEPNAYHMCCVCPIQTNIVKCVQEEATVQVFVALMLLRSSVYHVRDEGLGLALEFVL